MISNKTQRRLDRASKGLPDENLPEDDRLLQEEADALGLTLDDIRKINDDFTDEEDEMDDDSAEAQRERDEFDKHFQINTD
jgi:hypothetical protein